MNPKVVYFSESAERAEPLADFLEFEGITVEAITDRPALARIIGTDHPVLVIYDHRSLRGQMTSMVKEARKIGGENLLILSVANAETLLLKDIEELGIDSTLQPSFDFEALHCTVRRLLLPEYERWKRRDSRRLVDDSVRFSMITPGGKVPFTRANMSMTGAKLDANDSATIEALYGLKSDQVIKLEITSPTEPGKPIQVKAITRWLANNSVGIEFYEFSKKSLKQLRLAASKE